VFSLVYRRASGDCVERRDSCGSKRNHAPSAPYLPVSVFMGNLTPWGVPLNILLNTSIVEFDTPDSDRPVETPELMKPIGSPIPGQVWNTNSPAAEV
jgi:hypothetical protein